MRASSVVRPQSGGGMTGASRLRPGVALTGDRRFVRDAPVETLRGEDASSDSYPGARSKTFRPGGMIAQAGRPEAKIAMVGWKADGSSSEPA